MKGNIPVEMGRVGLQDRYKCGGIDTNKVRAQSLHRVRVEIVKMPKEERRANGGGGGINLEYKATKATGEIL